MVAVYRNAHRIARQRKSEEMWLQGLYFYAALNASMHNALSKKGAPKQSYIEEPIRITPYTPEEKAEMAQRERMKTIEYFNRLAGKHGKPLLESDE